MHIRQAQIRTASTTSLDDLQAIKPQLVLVFGAVSYFSDAAFVAALASTFPDAIRIGCSTAGEITRAGVADGSCVITAVHFEHSQLREANTLLGNMEDSHAAGERLAQQLTGNDLKAAMVFGQGIAINGSALISGMSDILGAGLPITGGLAGDGGAFKQTWVLGSTEASAEQLVAVGFYGERLQLAHGSYGGWEPFGPARKVTRCSGNVLYELDGEPALAIYKRYLGDYAKDLPASGLLFPFAMSSTVAGEAELIRTILGIDEAAGSLILAGEINPDGHLKLMHASSDDLVDGSEKATEALLSMRGDQNEGLAVLVSCVGRKLVMGGRVDEEVEAVADLLGAQTVISGFYSYGEISPTGVAQDCKLHNQTMTIAFLSER